MLCYLSFFFDADLMDESELCALDGQIDATPCEIVNIEVQECQVCVKNI